MGKKRLLGKKEIVRKKRCIAGTLALLIFISFTSINVYAESEYEIDFTAGQDIEEREKEIQKLISEKVSLKSEILYAEEEKSILQQRYNEVCLQ